MEAKMVKLKKQLEPSVWLTLLQVLTNMQETMAKSIVAFTESDEIIRDKHIFFLLGITARMHEFDKQGAKSIAALRKQLQMPVEEKKPKKKKQKKAGNE